MSVEKLRRAIELSKADPVVYGWLVDGIAAVEDGGRLDEALGLRGRKAKRRRNALIARAAELAAPGAPSYRQAAAVVHAIGVARRTIDRSEISMTLRNAAIYGPLPESQRQLHTIICAEKKRNEFQQRAG